MLPWAGVWEGLDSYFSLRLHTICTSQSLVRKRKPCQRNPWSRQDGDRTVVLTLKRVRLSGLWVKQEVV